MNIFGQIDFERWMIVIFITLSLYFLWTNKGQSSRYPDRVKLLLSIPRLYLIFYYVLVIFDAYMFTPIVNDIVKSGTGSVYGVLTLFAVEAYVRRQNKKYGRC
jgi:hypothetical protein